MSEQHTFSADKANRDFPAAAMPDLSPRIQEACKRAGWSQLAPVQARSIPVILGREDLMVQSRTGSGKTGAFLLPYLERLDPNQPQCQALILVPTRELARQVNAEAQVLFQNSGLRTAAVFGGVGYKEQFDALREGAHVVVGTPGRILDHLLKGSFETKGLRIVVMDEADRMLSMGFYQDMVQIRGYLPKSIENSYLFSATFPSHVLRLSSQFLNDPGFLSLSSDTLNVAEIEHSYYVVPAVQRERSLVRILEYLNPVSALIFCNTKDDVHFVTTVLQRFGLDADELTSDLRQNKREQVLGRIKSGNLRLLVATDVAARGIDIPDLSHVIQYQPSEDPELYVHRAGRTGRAGASGEAVTLAAGMEKIKLNQTAKKFRIPMQERELPAEETVNDVVGQRLTAVLEAELRSRDLVQQERAKRFVKLAKELGDNEESAMLLGMLLDEAAQKASQKAAPPKEQETEAPPNSDAASKAKKKRRRPRKKKPSTDSGQGPNHT
ncbi:MAG: DEAD/DEAH box helicase [Thermodesulfobacteriota bacterium]